MAAVPITMVGVSTDDTGQTKSVTFIGMASITGLGIGGGPIIPPKPPDSGAHPEHPIYWPPGTQPHPEHPIVLPPIYPGGPPIDIGAHPEHPIVLPPPPDTTPPPPGMAVKPPPDTGGWAYVQPWGWGFFPKGSTTPGPKA